MERAWATANKRAYSLFPSSLPTDFLIFSRIHKTNEQMDSDSSYADPTPPEQPTPLATETDGSESRLGRATDSNAEQNVESYQTDKQTYLCSRRAEQLVAENSTRAVFVTYPHILPAGNVPNIYWHGLYVLIMF